MSKQPFSRSQTPKREKPRYRVAAFGLNFVVECQPDNPICLCYGRTSAERIARALNAHAPRKGK